MLKRLTLNRVDPVSAGKVFGCLYAFLGIFGGMFIGGMMLLEAGVNRGGNGPGESFGLILGAMMLVLVPIGYGLMGFIIGLLMSLVYNLVAGYFGGLVLEVNDESEDDED